MGDKDLDMIDLAFDLQGSTVPADYAFELWREVVRCLPWLEAEPYAGILPLRIPSSGAGMLLPQRAKLILRLPTERTPQAVSLSGQELDIAGSVLSVGAAKERPLQPHSTLHAHLVESSYEEEDFLEDIASQLREMGIACNWICGKRDKVQGSNWSVSGYSLVLHALKPEDSLRLQRAGLGGARRFGCGIFVPYKSIPNLG